MKVWRASSPSNIALIKYMGKSDPKVNRPTNRSLSWTLRHLLTHVELQALPNESADRWEPLSGLAELHLSPDGVRRYLAHLQRIKDHFGVQGAWLVRSGNGFPSDCGLASSASSFAALTRCAFQAMGDESAVSEMARLSGQGSGSSCRSFFAPWALWGASGAEPIDLPGQDWHHQVVVVDQQRKQVSSSQAHLRVTSSALFTGRPERAERRLDDLIAALRQGEWERAFNLTWAEFWDMHALFETCDPPFGYMTPKSLATLAVAREAWREHRDGPLVTMDAGANVHLLYRADQLPLARQLGAELSAVGRVLSSYDPQFARVDL